MQYASMASEGMGQSLWQACVDQLAQELSEQQFNTWIKPLTAVVADDLSRITVYVANRFKLDWIRAQYAGKIASMAEKLYGQPVIVELALSPREAAARVLPRAVMTDTDAPRDSVSPSEEPVNPAFKNRLNSGLTFDTLVEGTPTAWRALPPCMWPACPATCTTRCSSTAASAWGKPI